MSQQRRAPRGGTDPYLDVWHRSPTLDRYLGRRARWVSLIDIDCCEFCHLCSEPVALIELKDVRAASKVGTVTARLASRAMIPAWLVEYEISDDGTDITRFIATPWHPVGEGPRELTPQEYAEWLWALRADHWKNECRNGAAGRMLGETR